MTDKGIIDGIDMSECEYYNKDDKTCREVNGKYDTDICDFDKCENYNCCFKQLKRKEQECEELNKQIEILKMQLKSLNEKFSRKRAVIEFADCPYYSYGDNTIEPTCNKNFCYDVKFCDHKNMVKLKQTLTEIREIAENVQSFVGRINIEDDVFEQMEQILQKLDEVE